MASLPIEQRPLPIPQTLTFRVVPSQASLPLPTRVSFHPVTIRVDATTPLAGELDEIIAQLGRRAGYAPEHIQSAVFHIVYPLVRDGKEATSPPLAITVQRSRRGPGFVARSSVTLAFGYGETIGAAFRDVIDDLLDRERTFRTERDRLGPGLREELAQVERFLARAR